MKANEMAVASGEVERRWPNADIVGFYGNATVILDVVVADQIVAHISCIDGSLCERAEPIPDRSRRRLDWML